jgi:hypothetical protein
MKRPKAVEHRFAARSLADGCEQPMLESLEAAVDEVLLAREVVEDRGRRDLGDAGDLGDADLLEAALAEQAPGGVGQQLLCSLLLSFPESDLDRHGPNCSSDQKLASIKKTCITKLRCGIRSG